MKRAKEFQRKIGERKFTGGVIENLAFVNAPGLSNRENLNRTYAVNANNFPVIPIAKDVRGDTEFKIKMDMRRGVDPNAPGAMGAGAYGPGDRRTVIDPSTPVPWTDKDTKYFEKKQAAEDQAAFAAWCRNRVNLTSSYAELDWAQRTMPFLFEPQEELLEQKLDDCNKYAKIRLRGPQTEEDWEFMYMVETGVIVLPKGPVWDPFNEALINAGVSWEQITSPYPDLDNIERKLADENFKSYRRGLFSPILPKTPSMGGKSANPLNKNDPTGKPKSNYVGPYGVTPTLKPDYQSAYGPSATDPALAGLRYYNATTVPGRRDIRNNSLREMEATAAVNNSFFSEPMDIVVP